MKKLKHFLILGTAAVLLLVGVASADLGTAPEADAESSVITTPRIDTAAARAADAASKAEEARQWALVAKWVDTTNYNTWMTRAVQYEQEQAEIRRAAAARQAAAEAQRRRNAPQHRSAPVEQGNGRCGGSLPPCYVMMRESGGNIRAENPTSTASGKWQFIDGTWGGYGGYSHASQAPEHVQDERARQLWAGGSGCSHWSAC